MDVRPENIAVLTGDLVSSSALSAEEIDEAFQALGAAADGQAAWTGTPLHFTRHRGDGWQAVLTKPHLALRSALHFRASLRSRSRTFDSYIGIAEGTVTHRIDPDLNRETTEVFARSGAMLEDLKTPDTKSSDTAIRMAHDAGGPANAAIILADQIFEHWTQAQARAMLFALGPADPLSYSEIAGRLGISRQAATKALKSAGWAHLIRALETMDHGATI